jgi:choline dehydrogenase
MDDFDFVIVGGGSAGCVLANRLTADGRARVCLVEAGPRDRHPAIHIPPLIGMAIQNPALNWGYTTAPQKNLNGRAVPVPRGRVLGGSSSINGMVYFRGHPGDFDDWAELGNPGWSYRDTLPYFLKSENNEEFRHSPYHGTQGPMHVATIARPNPLVHQFLRATAALNLKQNADFNAADPEGFGTRQATIRHGRRESMATAFLKTALRRPNLTVLTGALVTRIIIENRRATGIDAVVDGEERKILARREVVLTAGAYGSPALLMLSGIGNGQDLTSLGIDVKHHLPEVGRNLRDHPAADLRLLTKNSEPYAFTWRALPRNAWNFIEYVLFRSGPIGSNVFEATGFTRSRPELSRPNLQLVFMPAARALTPLPLQHGYGIISIAARPKSVGSVTLATADPRTAPRIDPNYLDHPDDWQTILFGLELGRRILADGAFAKYRGQEIVPGTGVLTESEWVDYVRKTAFGVHHPSSTCRMGGDEASVVDPQLRVRGIQGLRVADASIFPTLIAGNTNAAVVMVAEKASDMILERAPLPAAELP